jgi:hypothetical protein
MPITKEKRQANDKWLLWTIQHLAPNGFWLWTDEKELFWMDGRDTKITATTERGLTKLKGILTIEFFNERVKLVPKPYVANKPYTGDK